MDNRHAQRTPFLSRPVGNPSVEVLRKMRNEVKCEVCGNWGKSPETISHTKEDCR